MSEEEPKDEPEEGGEKKPEPPKVPSKQSISGISAAMDDLSFSLGLTFPSFGMNLRPKGGMNYSGGAATNSSIYQPKYAPSYGDTRGGSGPLGPRDLMSRNERKEVVQNELLLDKRTRPNTVQPNQGMTSPPAERRDFGIQTSDSLYAKNGGGFPMNTLGSNSTGGPMPALQNSQPRPGMGEGGFNNQRRVDFTDKPPSFKDRAANNTPYDISASNMKQFTKNVQDLYKRKQKAVYGEDEFKIAKNMN